MNKEMIRAQLASVPLQRKVVSLRGMDFIVQEMNGSAREKYELFLSTKSGEDGKITDPSGLKSQLVAACLVDEAGERVYGDHEINLINSLPGEIVDRLAAVAMELNGLQKEAQDQAAKK